MAEEYYLDLQRRVPLSLPLLSGQFRRCPGRTRGRKARASPMSTWTWVSAACRSTRRREASPTTTMRHSTCAWTRVSQITAADILNSWSEAAPDRPVQLATARSGTPAGSPGPWSIGDEASPSSTQRSWWRPSSAPSPPPLALAPATRRRRVFQALRIEVNDELNSLRQRASRGLRPARARRGHGRHQFPLPGRPPRQGVLRGQSPWMHVPARLPSVRMWGQG